jgi:hypothetical protein
MFSTLPLWLIRKASPLLLRTLCHVIDAWVQHHWVLVLGLDGIACWFISFLFYVVMAPTWAYIPKTKPPTTPVITYAISGARDNRKSFELQEGKWREMCEQQEMIIYGGKAIERTHRSKGHIRGSAFLVTSLCLPSLCSRLVRLCWAFRETSIYGSRGTGAETRPIIEDTQPPNLCNATKKTTK